LCEAKPLQVLILLRFDKDGDYCEPFIENDPIVSLYLAVKILRNKKG
jgi:hypothetical protein